MNRFVRKIVEVAVFISVQSMIATPSHREALSASEGQLLVERFFAENEFNTGEWGNDISMVLPFQWLSAQKKIFAMVSLAEHKRTHEADWFVKQIYDGRLQHCKYDFSPETDVVFLPEELYELQYSNGRTKLCYHNEMFRGSDAETDGVMFIESSIWYELEVLTNGWPRKCVCEEWPERLFADRSLKSVQSIVPHRFRGPKANPVKEKDRMETRLDEYETMQSGWHMDGKTMEALANLHRKYVAEVFPSNEVDSVFIVVCDANHDGKCDAYVSSDAEKAEADKYRWSLYIWGMTGFVRQKEPTKFFGTDKEYLYLETDVIAAKEDFFRIDRIKMQPYVLVLSEHNGHPESWSYVHHDSPVRTFRNRNGFANADFFSCLKYGQSGVSSIKDLFLSYYSIVRAERLECISFPED